MIAGRLHVSSCELPDGLGQVVVEPSDCKLLHTGNFSDSSSEAFRRRLSGSFREAKVIGQALQRCPSVGRGEQ